jgi:hypothetical protein
MHLLRHGSLTEQQVLFLQADLDLLICRHFSSQVAYMDHSPLKVACPQQTARR